MSQYTRCKPILWLLVLIFSTTSKAEHEHRLIYGDSYFGKYIDPYTINDIRVQRIADLIFEGLFELSHQNTFVPKLAKSFRVSKNKLDVYLTLKEGVSWHPNRTNSHAIFSARDVIKTISLIQNQESQIPNRGQYDIIKEVKALGKFKLRISLARITENPLKYLTFKIIPALSFLNKSKIEAKSDFALHPIGTGPYMINPEKQLSAQELVRNPRYHGKLPRIKSIIIKYFYDQNIMTQALMFRSLDLISHIPSSRIPEVSHDKNISLIPYNSLSYSYIALNLTRPLLNNVRFRRALRYVPARQEMLQAFFLNKGNLISGPFPPHSWAYNIDIENFKQDLDQARNIFSAIGLKFDRNKRLLDRKSQPISFEFLVPINGKNRLIKNIAVAFQSYMDKVGIKVKLVFLPWHLWKIRVLKERNFDITMASWQFDDDANIKSLFHSAHIYPWGNNFIQYSNAEVDSLITEANATYDFDKKRAISHKLHSILAHDVPYIFLWTLKNHAVHQNNLIGIKIDPYSFFKHISHWSLQKGMKIW